MEQGARNKDGRVSLKEILSGSIFTNDFFRKQYKLLALIAFLIFVYIYNGFRSQGQQRQIKLLNEEIKEARYEMLELSSRYTQMTRPSAINRQLKEKGSGVQESTTPPTLIK